MDSRKIGELISKRRKEKFLTQQELGEMLNVSAKTISKWERGVNLPDIVYLKELSEALGISLNSLIEGKSEVGKIGGRKNNKLIFISMLILVFVILIVIYICLNKNVDSKKYECNLVKTYNIVAINDSNDENYLYATVKEFQEEGVYTVKLSRIIAKELKENYNYEFTFNTNIDNISEKPNIIFNNSEILDIKETDKLGLQQTNSITCK